MADESFKKEKQQLLLNKNHNNDNYELSSEDIFRKLTDKYVVGHFIIGSYYLFNIIWSFASTTGFNSTDAIILLSILGLITIVYLTSYFIAMFSNPGYDIPIQFRRTPKDENERYCDKCHLTKPERTHHCKYCQRCVLRFDHHVNLQLFLSFLNFGKYFFFLLIIFDVFIRLYFMIDLWCVCVLID